MATVKLSSTGPTSITSKRGFPSSAIFPSGAAAGLSIPQTSSFSLQRSKFYYATLITSKMRFPSFCKEAKPIMQRPSRRRGGSGHPGELPPRQELPNTGGGRREGHAEDYCEAFRHPVRRVARRERQPAALSMLSPPPRYTHWLALAAQPRPRHEVPKHVPDPKKAKVVNQGAATPTHSHVCTADAAS